MEARVVAELGIGGVFEVTTVLFEGGKSGERSLG